MSTPVREGQVSRLVSLYWEWEDFAATADFECRADVAIDERFRACWDAATRNSTPEERVAADSRIWGDGG